MKHQFYLQEPTFRVGNIDVQRVSRPKNYRHSFRYGREKHGFIYIVKGKMRDSFRVGSVRDLTAERGDLIFIPRGSIYTGVYLEDDTEIKIVQFDLISGELPDYLSTPVRIDIPNAGKRIDAFFSPIEPHAAQHPFYILSCLYELLWHIDEASDPVPLKYRRLYPALSALTENWQKNDKISHYAALCGISEATFRRLFREYTGLSPIEYRNELRLKNAKGRLQSGEYSVSEAAYACGFSNLSFFIRLYKKKYGHTPKNG